MDEIIAMRKKNLPNSPTKIKELLHQISNDYFQSDKITLQLEENESRITELSKDVTDLKEEFETEKQKLERKQLELDENTRLMKDAEEERDILDISLREIENKHKSIKKSKPSLRDQQLIETGKRKHKLYKEFTCVRWDYAAPESMIEGYITNKKDYLQKISFKSDINYQNLRNTLWDNIYQSTLNHKETEECKENQPNNN